MEARFFAHPRQHIWYNRCMHTKIIDLPVTVKKSILACGADLKGAFAIARGKTAFLYEGFGDLGDLGNFERYEKAVAGAVRATGIKPRLIAHDMHPGYFSTRFALSCASSRKICAPYAVWHHQAHIASSLAENRIKGGVIGVAFDGTGYGPDGNIWGGEFFAGDPGGFKRMAHLEYMAMPGADAAIRQPWRMAASYIYRASGRCKDLLIKKMIDRSINSPLTSSAGRLFDACASIILKKKAARFEAELPIELEKIAAKGTDDRYKYDIIPGSCVTLSCDPMVRGIISDMDRGLNKAAVSAKFHNTVAHMTAKTAAIISGKSRLKKVILSGGVFQNRYLTAKTVQYMNKAGLSVYLHDNISTNDSGIPIGQILIAARRNICA